jgi:hypothetical protein
VAQIEEVFDPQLTPVWDVLHVNSPMLSGFTEGLGLRVGLFPSQLCLVFIEEVKSMGALDSSLRHV